MLLVRSERSDNNACALSKLLFDKKVHLVKVHTAAEGLDPKIAKESTPVELRPGSAQALGTLT